ncbi:hypothetical protein SDC9_114277 [bioreactor metagenome]|uniref:Uncharacterized protein n=1 Tax=bioreactor metagenome TaxID=1076179 RepID=A0A645BPZ7_9ZZZZ
MILTAVKETLLLFLALFLGINQIYILGIPTILIISCLCITGLFYTGFTEILVNTETEDCTLGIINIFLGFVLLGMTLTNNIVV